jgi:hypothetical protein
MIEVDPTGVLTETGGQYMFISVVTWDATPCATLSRFWRNVYPEDGSDTLLRHVTSRNITAGEKEKRERTRKRRHELKRKLRGRLSRLTLMCVFSIY